MKRSTAFNGFYKTLKEIQGYEKQAQEQGHSCNISTKWKMAEMRAKKYAKSLVVEHDFQDIHTKKYIERR
jgi:pterin-4a-carbinolamine dehydratase